MSSKIVEALEIGLSFAMQDSMARHGGPVSRSVALIESALAEARAAQSGEWVMVPRDPHRGERYTLGEWSYRNWMAALADQAAAPPAPAAVPALDVFRIAGGDVECCPEPTASHALDCLRDLRKCYDELLSAPAAEPVGRLSIEHFRGSRAMENVDFEYTGQLEPGTYQVYTTPPPVAKAAEPVAWARRWHIDGETPEKERNANGRMAWPAKFKMMPVTVTQALPDDVPLYTTPPPVAKAAEPVAWPTEAELIAFGTVEQHFLSCDQEDYAQIALEILAKFGRRLPPPVEASQQQASRGREAMTRSEAIAALSTSSAPVKAVWYTSVQAERDALLTVRETLKRECEALKAELSAAKAAAEANAAENAALRKDAERYLWVLLHADTAQVQMLMDRRGDIPSQRKVCDVGMNALTNAGET